MMETKNESNISMTSHPLSVARLGATTMLLYQIYHDAATWKAPPIRLFPSNSSILKNCIFPWTCFPLFDPAVLWFFPYNSYISPAAFLLISQCRLIWTYAMIIWYHNTRCKIHPIISYLKFQIYAKNEPSFFIVSCRLLLFQSPL